MPFTTGSRESDAAFTAAAARFFELLKTFSGQPSASHGQVPDWSSFGTLLAGQFEQWLRSAPAAGASFAAAAGFPGAAVGWPPGAVPLGPAAAQAADAQSAWELLMKLGALQGELARHWSAIAQDSAQRFIARMQASGGADFSSERALALYEIWVECAEEAYAATVRRDDFCRLQAQLTNTAMALLLAQRKQADKLARAWGLPTREEADALQRQIRELRKKLEERAAEPMPRTPPRRPAAQRPKATPRSKPKAAGGGRSRRSVTRRGRH
ncbi:MAG TPA: poly(R)-hydroxyalkanoic acid synthase subunit PhaE [Steroidobacteraceae bacterium]|nr:poly(R)-hydroxyalkanoic acid synthase subunit PhaE [Steroidobacteraceae bacterium]